MASKTHTNLKGKVVCASLIPITRIQNALHAFNWSNILVRLVHNVGEVKENNKENTCLKTSPTDNKAPRIACFLNLFFFVRL